MEMIGQAVGRVTYSEVRQTWAVSPEAPRWASDSVEL